MNALQELAANLERIDGVALKVGGNLLRAEVAERASEHVERAVSRITDLVIAHGASAAEVQDLVEVLLHELVEKEVSKMGGQLAVKYPQMFKGG